MHMQYFPHNIPMNGCSYVNQCIYIYHYLTYCCKKKNLKKALLPRWTVICTEYLSSGIMCIDVVFVFLFFDFDFCNLSLKCTHLGLIWERAFKDPASDTIILLSPIRVCLFYHHQNAASCQSHVEQSFHAASPSAPTVRLAPLAAHMATSLLSVKCSTRVGRRPVTGGTLREILPTSWRITISHHVHVSQPAFRDTVTLTAHHFVMLVRGGGARWLSKCITVLHPPLSLVLITVAGGGAVRVGVGINGGIYTSFLFNFLCSVKILLLIKCESCLFPIASLFNRLHTQ